MKTVRAEEAHEEVHVWGRLQKSISYWVAPQGGGIP